MGYASVSQRVPPPPQRGDAVSEVYDDERGWERRATYLTWERAVQLMQVYGLSRTARDVLQCLAAHDMPRGNHRSGTIEGLFYRDIGEEVGVGTAAVCKAVQELADAGLLQVASSPGRGHAAILRLEYGAWIHAWTTGETFPAGNDTPSGDGKRFPQETIRGINVSPRKRLYVDPDPDPDLPPTPPTDADDEAALGEREETAAPQTPVIPADPLDDTRPTPPPDSPDWHTLLPAMSLGMRASQPEYREVLAMLPTHGHVRAVRDEVKRLRTERGRGARIWWSEVGERVHGVVAEVDAARAARRSETRAMSRDDVRRYLQTGGRRDDA